MQVKHILNEVYGIQEAYIPARIVRYRYKPEEIEALNKIVWWAWGKSGKNRNGREQGMLRWSIL